jgi:hypothetical protein
MTGKLLRGGQEAEEVLESAGPGGLVIWCPDNQEDMGRTGAAVVKAVGMGRNVRVTVVIPLEPRPGCHVVNQHLDTWTHPMIKGKCSGVSQ